MKRWNRISAMLLLAVTGMSMFSGCDGKSGGDKTTSPSMRDISAADLVSEMRLGWNLGNTLDAHDSSITSKLPADYETCWGNPVTTKEMVEAVKAKGFNVIRVPVTWTGHIGAAPDYKIDEVWMNRVQEVVDYVISSDLFCIINLHHEDWHFPSDENYAAAKDEMQAVWRQIAARFQDYNERLLFEGMNEPRMVDTSYEWTGGTEESRRVINQLNADFLSVIRTSGGNNPKRHLLIPTYAAAATTETLGQFQLPENDNKVIISIHAYTPYDFALKPTGTFSFDPETDAGQIDSLLQSLDSAFLKKGYPVILSEFGARNRYNTDARCAWAEYYVKSATAYHIPCIWWDNGAFTSGEAFGLLNRRTMTWEYPEILEALERGLAS